MVDWVTFTVAIGILAFFNLVLLCMMLRIKSGGLSEGPHWSTNNYYSTWITVNKSEPSDVTEGEEGVTPCP